MKEKDKLEFLEFDNDIIPRHLWISIATMSIKFDVIFIIAILKLLLNFSHELFIILVIIEVIISSIYYIITHSTPLRLYAIIFNWIDDVIKL